MQCRLQACKEYYRRKYIETVLFWTDYWFPWYDADIVQGYRREEFRTAISRESEESFAGSGTDQEDDSPLRLRAVPGIREG
jgi:hypothetical protein